MKCDSTSRSHNSPEEPSRLIPVTILSDVCPSVWKQCSMTLLLISPPVLSWFNNSTFTVRAAVETEWNDLMIPGAFPLRRHIHDIECLHYCMDCYEVCTNIFVPCVACCSHTVLPKLSLPPPWAIKVLFPKSNKRRKSKKESTAEEQKWSTCAEKCVSCVNGRVSGHTWSSGVSLASFIHSSHGLGLPGSGSMPP